MFFLHFCHHDYHQFSVVAVVTLVFEVTLSCSAADASNLHHESPTIRSLSCKLSNPCTSFQTYYFFFNVESDQELQTACYHPSQLQALGLNVCFTNCSTSIFTRQRSSASTLPRCKHSQHFSVKFRGFSAALAQDRRVYSQA
jgi:hypothetical protein